MYNKRELKKTERKQDKRNPFSRDMIYDPRGQWDNPGENTRIPGGNITMQGVPYPVYGVPYFNGEKGQGVMMQPGQNYSFPGADYVDEFPKMQQQPSHQMPDGTWMPGEEHGEYEDMELTDEEIEEYKRGGCVVQELPRAQDGVTASGPSSNQLTPLVEPPVVEPPVEISQEDRWNATMDWINTHPYEDMPEWKKLEEIKTSNYPNMNASGRLRLPTSGVNVNPYTEDGKGYMYQQAEIGEDYKGLNIVIINGKPVVVPPSDADNKLKRQYTDFNKKYLHVMEKPSLIGKSETFHVYGQGMPYKPDLIDTYKERYPQVFNKDDLTESLQDGGSIEMDLTNEEIQYYKDNGYDIEELPKAQNGIPPKWKQNPDGSWTQMADDYVAPVEPESPIITFHKKKLAEEAAAKKAPKKEERPYDPVLDNPAYNIPDEGTLNRVAQQYIGGPDMKTVSDQTMLREKQNLGRPWSPDTMKQSDPNDPNHISFGAPENPTFGDYAGRAWDMITNPIAAFDYSVRTGDVGNMPWNYNQLQDLGVQVGPQYNPLTMANSMVNPLKMSDNLVRSNSPLEFAANAAAFIPYAGPIARGSKTALNAGNKAFQTYRPVNKLKHINQYNIEKQLGEKIAGNTGQFNQGVYNLKKFPDDLVKFENPAYIAKNQHMPQYTDIDLAKMMKNIPEENIGKVKRQLDFPEQPYPLKEGPRAGQRALIMNKVPGVKPTDLTLDDWFAMEPQAIQNFQKNLNLLKNENLGYDFVGQNYAFDPVKQQFNIFDVIPHSPIKKFNPNTNFWQDEVFGGGNPYIYGQRKAGLNLNKAMQERLHFDVGESARKAGIVSDDFDEIRRMWQEKMDRSLRGLQDGGFIEEEMTADQISSLRANGYEIEEL
jgi:hypothetical protein